MTAETPVKQRGLGHYLLWWVAPITLLVLGLFAWSNHAHDGFHADDFHVIVNNRAIRSLANIPRFFTHPRAFSSEPEFADYKPLLLTTFALDASLSKNGDPVVYQLDTLVWFVLLVMAVYFLLKLVPDGGHTSALGAAALIALHPISAETVNYISQRGSIMGALSVCLTMAFWIVWPRRLPQKLGLNLDRVPQNWRQDQIRQHGAKWERQYKRFLRLPIPFYLIPLVPGLLSDPNCAVVVLLLAAYVWLYERKEGFARLIPMSAVCGVYWVGYTILSWVVSPLFRIPTLSYWISQPWVALRYCFWFFVPGALNADTGFGPVSWFWPPFALLGLAGVAGIVLAARRLASNREWRGVAFGLCWFLIALVPYALIPQRTVEANSRMFPAVIGLAFGVSQMVEILLRRFSRLPLPMPKKMAGYTVAGLLAVAIFGYLLIRTSQLNEIWQTEASLWLDVTDKAPSNVRGLLHYVNALIEDDDDATAMVYLQRAAPLADGDAVLQLLLAQDFDRLDKKAEAEVHFRKALQLAPDYSAANSLYGQWLLTQRKKEDAFRYATKGLEKNPNDLISRHTLMDIYAERSDWPTVTKLAKEAVKIEPDDPEGNREITVAQASIDHLQKAEEDSKASGTVDDFLRLSEIYFHNQRYEDCIRAARSALELHPNMGEAWANIAAAEHARGRDDRAIQALREVVRLRPDFTFAKIDLELLLEKKSDNPGGQ